MILLYYIQVRYGVTMGLRTRDHSRVRPRADAKWPGRVARITPQRMRTGETTSRASVRVSQRSIREIYRDDIRVLPRSSNRSTSFYYRILLICA